MLAPAPGPFWAMRNHERDKALAEVAYQEGRAAFDRHQSRLDSPYKHNAWGRWNYERGWWARYIETEGEAQASQPEAAGCPPGCPCACHGVSK